MNKKMSKRALQGIVSFLGLVGLGFLVFDPEILKKAPTSVVSTESDLSLGAFPITLPTLKYGFAMDTFVVVQQNINSGQFLADILLEQQVAYIDIEKIAKNAQGVFDVRHLRAGQPYSVLKNPVSGVAQFMVYEPSVYEYVVFQLTDSFKVTKTSHPIEIRPRATAGLIESNLWDAMVDNGASFSLVDKMEDALQWSVDFYHIQKEDAFKLIYDENYIDGKAVGVEKVKAAYFKTSDKEYYAIYFEADSIKGYYDLEGKPMKRSFLKTPVKFSRISSYYNLNRLHPILKYRRPHYGTDYAAPYGTEIYAVGDGVVTQASYTSGNGNFVRLKHDKIYETQYLHMSKFASGIRAGVHVKQGEVIGYVGSTGLATGPHVCFRFWKNGQQINHLKLDFPQAAPLPDAVMASFKSLRDAYLLELASLKLIAHHQDSLFSASSTDSVALNP